MPDKKTGYIAMLAAGVGIGWLAHGIYYSDSIPSSSIPGNLQPRVVDEADEIFQYGNEDGLDKSVDAASGQSKQQSGSEAENSHSESKNVLNPGSGISIAELLSNQNYREAVELYSIEKDPDLQNNFRNQILNFAAELIKGKTWIEAEKLLHAYLKLEYRDVAALGLKVRMLLNRKNYFSAVRTMYEIRTYEHEPDKLLILNEQIRQIVRVYNAELDSSERYQQKQELFEYLTDIEPDHAPYFIDLAGAQIELGQLQGAKQSLQLVVQDPQVGKLAQQMLLKIGPKLAVTKLSKDDELVQQPVVIPLSRVGNHFIVEAWINDRTPIRLLIDTGASITVFSTRLIESLQPQLPIMKVTRFNTANGSLLANVHYLDSLTVGGQIVSGLAVGGLGMEELDTADGLLGMDFLNHFKFSIDQNENVLRLIPSG